MEAGAVVFVCLQVDGSRLNVSGILVHKSTARCLIAIPADVPESLASQCYSVDVAAQAGEDDIALLLFKLPSTMVVAAKPIAWKSFVRFPRAPEKRPQLAALAELSTVSEVPDLGSISDDSLARSWAPKPRSTLVPQTSPMYVQRQPQSDDFASASGSEDDVQHPAASPS